MSKTNIGLVQYVESKLNVPTIYMLGGIGRKLTAAMVNARIAKGDQHTKRNELIIRAGIGKYVFDCNALMKCYLWETAPGVINYKSEHDIGSTGLYNRSKVKGPMSTMPDVPGLLVWTADLGHVGVYVGKKNGINQYVEATPAWNAWGVTTSADKNHPQGHNRKWTYWGEYHLIEYIKEKPTEPKKTVDELAKEVLAGKWGNGAERKANLEKAGYDYNAVQAKVNELSKQKPTTPEPTKPTELKVGDKVEWSGYIYRDSFGGGRQASYPKRVGTIKRLNDNAYGVHIDNLGWIARKQIVGQVDYVKPEDPKIFKVGDKVKAIGTNYATGQKIPAWVKSNTYQIKEISKDKGLLTGINSWVYLKDLKKV